MLMVAYVVLYIENSKNGLKNDTMQHQIVKCQCVAE